MEDSVQVGRTLLAICVFLVLVCFDVLKGFKTGDKWIQGGFLTLSALNIQYLGYFDAQNINLFGKPNGEELQALFNKQLSVDVARLVFCTFLGYVLPGVAFHSSEGRWSSIAALAVSLGMHMASEVYMLQNTHDPSFRNGGKAMFISSSMLLLVAAISLVLYIGLAVINCKFTRDRLNFKIPKMLEGSVKSDIFEGNEGEESVQSDIHFEGNEGEESVQSDIHFEGNEGEVFKLWAVVRGCQQEFWLVSSAFTPAVFMVVTTCVAVVVADLISRQSLLHHGNYSVRLTLWLQCAFILTGWIILVWRWVIFLSLCVSRKSDFFAYVEYTGVYEIRFCRLICFCIRRALSLKPGTTYVWKALRVLVFLIFLIIMLPVSLFFVVICLLVLFNFFCARVSSMLVWSVIKVAHAINCINMFGHWVSDAEVSLDTEACEILYVADSSNKRTKRLMKAAYAKGKKESGIIVKVIKHPVDGSREEIRRQLSSVQDIYYYIGAWKMTAVAAIAILAELADDKNSNRILKHAVKAYREVQNLLAFLDFPDNIKASSLNFFVSRSSRAYQMNLEADIKMQEIEELVGINKYRRTELLFKGVAELVKEFAGRGTASLERNSNFYQYWSGRRLLATLSYHEGTGTLQIFSMKCVCQAIYKESYSNKVEMIDRAARCLGDIIACAVLRLPEVLPKYSRQWAEEFKEENLIKALAMQEKFKAVKEMLPSADTVP